MANSSAISLEEVSIDGDTISFHLTRAPDLVVQGLQKLLMDELPTMAIDLVEIRTNQSVLNDEFLALRIGQIPLRSHRAKDFRFKKDCPCLEFCSQCGVEFFLSAIDSGVGTLDVTQEYLINDQAEKEGTDSETTRLASVVPVIYGGPLIIIKLVRQQTLDIRCIARKGRGRDHAKWSPVCRVTTLPTSQTGEFQVTIETIGQYTGEEILAECRTFLSQH